MPAQAQRKDVGAGEILHCDIKGPLDLAYNRARYALVVVDESTRMVAAKEMRTKDQVVDALKSIISSFSHHPGKKIVVSEGTSTLHSDSEAVLKSKEMLAFLQAQRITARASPPQFFVTGFEPGTSRTASRAHNLLAKSGTTVVDVEIA